MKTTHLSALLFGIVLLSASLGRAEARVGDWVHFNGVLASIAANDYKAFCAHGDSKDNKLQANVSEKAFAKLSTELRPILLKGYDVKVVGYAEKSLDQIFITWELYHDRDKPKMILKLAVSGPAGPVSDFKIE